MQAKPAQQRLRAEYEAVARQNHLLPVKVTRHYQTLVDEEESAIGVGGPLHRSVLPTRERLDLTAPGELRDYVDDVGNMPEGLENIVVRKYANRILFLPTLGCVGHCQYCFRQDILSQDRTSELRALEGKIDLLKIYLAQRPEITEVILSGGDPLALPTADVVRLLSEIVSIGREVRIHTRGPVFAPDLLNEQLIDALATYEARLVLHVVHPYELADSLRERLETARRKGVRLYSQFPLLRGINDHLAVLWELLAQLDSLNVRNLTIFVPDPISYSATFRLRLERAFSLMDGLNAQAAAYVNSTRLVVDTHYGKVRRSQLISGPDQDGNIVFDKNGHRVTYVDFPAELDLPGDASRLLWKGSRFANHLV